MTNYMFTPGKEDMKFFRVEVTDGGQRSPLDKLIFEQRLEGREGARHGDT